jgi:adenylyl-sulfate kinase
MLVNELQVRGVKAELLDGEEMRMNLSPELGFSRKDREMHAKRMAFLSHLLSKNRIISVVASISPYRSSREYARNLIKNFVEAWLSTSVETCMKRDLKGLYKKATIGQISNLTGVQDPYEVPTSPDVVIDSELINNIPQYQDPA